MSQSTLLFFSFIDSLDPEKLMQCPYDKNHQIRACRFPYHLVKCRKVGVKQWMLNLYHYIPCLLPKYVHIVLKCDNCKKMQCLLGALFAWCNYFCTWQWHKCSSKAIFLLLLIGFLKCSSVETVQSGSNTDVILHWYAMDESNIATLTCTG